jgi:hypothetical protein
VYSKIYIKTYGKLKLVTPSFCFLWDEFSLKVFCREENILFDDFVRVQVTFQDIREYPLLFDVGIVQRVRL